MPLYCRGCSAAANQDVYRAAKKFIYADHSNLWTQVISQGMERFCTKFSAKSNRPEAMEEDPKHQSAKAQLYAWWNTNQRARQGSARSSDFCNQCARIEIKCQKCSKTSHKVKMKRLRAFDFERLLHVKKNRMLTNRAVCLACDKGEAVKHKEKPKQNSYECSVCRKDLPLRYFHVSALLKLEAEDRIYAATCSSCGLSQLDTGPPTQATVRCKVCKEAKPLQAFSSARQHSHKNKDEWACLECEYPTCSASGCNAKPDRPHIGAFMCAKCRYPPCIGCGKARPPRSHIKDNSVQVKPVWKCIDCRAKLTGANSEDNQLL